jgi:hypothetical protein
VRKKGVASTIYRQFDQDELGIFTVVGSEVEVAWLNDPDW